MIKIDIPSYVNKALDIINTYGEAFIVGGCVRDSILGRTPNDYDITTNLEPKEIMSIFSEFKQINNNGIKHGTVSVIIEDHILEITTYRIDGAYTDGRHPNEVNFTKSLKEDLARRDFTINAMAYNSNKGLIDYFDGLKDLENKIIRTVGDPYKRFSEDYLRILRALRFRGRYNFTIENNTKEAINSLASNLNLISRERINQELQEILLSDTIFEILTDYSSVFSTIIPEMIPNIGFNQHSKWHKYDVYTHICYVTAYVKPIFNLRLAAVLHDIGKAYCYTEEYEGDKLVRHFRGHAKKSKELAINILDNLRVSNKAKEEILYLINYHDYPLNNDKNIKKLIIKTPNLSLDLLMNLIDLKEADSSNHLIQYEDFNALRDKVKNIYNSLEVKSIKDLDINGNELINLGINGPEIGETLHHLFELVLFSGLPNKKEKLIKHIKRCDKAN